MTQVYTTGARTVKPPSSFSHCILNTKINRKLNTFTYSEYDHLLEYYKKYTDFNTLGLFRSITENKKLDLEQKIKTRDLAVTAFLKAFEFL